jgi:type IV pilus assembly protein PilY1
MIADNSAFSGVSNAATGMGMPGVALGPQGNVLYAYAGDLQGNLWKFDLTGGTSEWSTSSNAKVLFTAQSSGGVPQPITTVPAVTINVLSGYQIGFGTGKFLEPSDALSTSAAQQSLYGIWDSGDGQTFQRNATTSPTVNGLISRTLTVTSGTVTVSITGSPFNYGTASPNYRGWFADLSTTLERVAVDPVVDSGLMAVNSTIPAGDPCATGGGSVQYRYNPTTGITFVSVSKSTVPSYLGTPSLLEVGDTAWSPRSSSGRYVVTRKINSLSPGVGGGISTTESTVTAIAGRIAWREITNFQ